VTINFSCCLVVVECCIAAVISFVIVVDKHIVMLC